MYFPVPPEVISNGEAWITVNGKPVDYKVVYEGRMYVRGDGVREFKYDSVLGVLPMLKWHLSLNSNYSKFTVNVTYRYVLKPVEVKVKNVGVMVHRTIYAMATGRFYYTYSKRVVAEVTIKFIGPKFNYATVNVSLVPPLKQEPTKGSTKIVLPYGNVGDGRVIKLVITSSLFKGMERDLLFEMIIPRSMPTITYSNTILEINSTTPNSSSTPYSPSSLQQKSIKTTIIAIIIAIIVTIVAMSRKLM